MAHTATACLKGVARSTLQQFFYGAPSAVFKDGASRQTPV